MKKILEESKKRITFDVYTSKKEILSYLETMFDIDTNSGKKKLKRDIFSNEKEREVFRNFVLFCSQFVQICILRFDGKAIAYNFNFAFGNHYVGYHTSYLAEYKHLSPGKLVVYCLIEYLAKSNYKLLDMGEGLSTYKQEFTKDYVMQYDLYMSNNSMVLQWWKLINTARRVKQIVLPEKNTRDHEFMFKTI
jgi:CelD/BcsL family acetyltransferase involved in cellulose biosynthesis